MIVGVIWRCVCLCTSNRAYIEHSLRKCHNSWDVWSLISWNSRLNVDICMWCTIALASWLYVWSGISIIYFVCFCYTEVDTITISPKRPVKRNFLQSELKTDFVLDSSETGTGGSLKERNKGSHRSIKERLGLKAENVADSKTGFSGMYCFVEF